MNYLAWPTLTNNFMAYLHFNFLWRCSISCDTRLFTELLDIKEYWTRCLKHQVEMCIKKAIRVQTYDDRVSFSSRLICTVNRKLGGFYFTRSSLENLQISVILNRPLRILRPVCLQGKYCEKFKLNVRQIDSVTWYTKSNLSREWETAFISIKIVLSNFGNMKKENN